AAAASLPGDVRIARQAAGVAAPASPPVPGVGPKQVRVDTSDGVSLDVREVGIHWELGRTVLDQVKPKGADRAEPGRDAMVRDWYRASPAWNHTVQRP